LRKENKEEQRRSNKGLEIHERKYLRKEPF